MNIKEVVKDYHKENDQVKKDQFLEMIVEYALELEKEKMVLLKTVTKLMAVLKDPSIKHFKTGDEH